MRIAALNTIVAVLALIVSAITAWYQFSPKSDAIILSNEGIISYDDVIDVDRVAIFTSDKTSRGAIGPIKWKVRIYNPMDRSISLISASPYYIDKDEVSSYWSGMDFKLLNSNISGEKKLPDAMEAYSAEEFVVSINMPFLYDLRISSECTKENVTLSEFEKCHWNSGVDLFGNEVNPVQYEKGVAGLSSYAFSSIKEYSRIKIQIETGDESSFNLTLPYYPFKNF